jgi:hypothetical protein
MPKKYLNYSVDKDAVQFEIHSKDTLSGMPRELLETRG